jgi:hypothetical protein
MEVTHPNAGCPDAREFVNIRAMRARSFIVVFCAFVAVTMFVLRFSGRLLILNNPEPSNVAIVEGGDDRSYLQALALLRHGNTHYLLLNMDPIDVDAGTGADERARAFVNESAPDVQDRVFIIPDSADEDEWIRAKLHELEAKSVLLVVPEASSRLRIAEFRRALPQYRWRALTVKYQEQFDEHWWRSRAWAKRFFGSSLAWVRWELAAP